MSESEEAVSDNRLNFSVPIGGIGAGSIQPGPDGRLRNITINNNRGPGEGIGISPASFLALRVDHAGLRYTRILQQESAKPGRYPDLGAPGLAKGQLRWRGLYPQVNYALRDPECPLDLSWKLFGPVIPFDHDASVLPISCIAVRCDNTSDESQDVSLVFNWENLCGHTATRTPPELARIMPTEVEYVLKHTSNMPIDRKAGAIGTRVEKAEASDFAGTAEPRSRYNGIIYGGNRSPRDNADGMYCLAARPDENVVFSVLAWDHEDAADRARFWYALNEHGEFFREDSNDRKPRSGAVCGRFQLAPGESRTLRFVLTWYCPRNVVKGENVGTGYTNLHRNAIDVAKNGLKHIDYYANSVIDWHQRISSSSFPDWLNAMLINSTHVFTTNTAQTRDGLFTLLESCSQPEEIQTQNRLYTSLGTLLWFPRFEDAGLRRLAALASSQAGRLLPDTQPDAPFTGPDLLAACTFVLSAYRNYRTLGNLARIQVLMPALQSALVAAMKADIDRDGIPEGTSPWFTYDGLEIRGASSYASSLWVAALYAFAHLARSMRQEKTATTFEHMARQAASRFESLFWIESAGYYRLFVEPNKPADEQTPLSMACHTGQLAGQWYADFLGLGSLFNRSRIVRALETLEEYNERTHGVASAMMPDGSICRNPKGCVREAEGHYAWPGFMNAHYACLQIHRGQVQRALRSLEKFYRNTLYKGSQQYDQPEKWNITSNTAVPDSQERHASALSIWYVLYAIQGLTLDVPDQRLRIMPNLPKGTHSLEAPMFTPTCLGRLRYQEDTLNGYRQRIHVSFDSPVSLTTIQLRVPANTGELGILFEVPDGRIPASFELSPFENARLLTIRPERPIIASSAVSVHVFTKQT